MRGIIEIGSKMSPLRIFLVLMTLAVASPVFAGESMGGDVSNMILAKGEILDRKVVHKSSYAYKVAFVYAVKYKGRIYHCIVNRDSTSCTGTSKAK